jgi:hypothetical protein
MSNERRKTPEELLDEFYTLEGQCISEWAATDEVLFFLCCRVLRCETELVAILYYKTPTLDSRLSLASDLVRSIIPKPSRSGEHQHADWKIWAEIENDFRRLLKIRNRIAHEPVWPTFRAEHNEGIKRGEVFISGFELYANRWDRSRSRGDKPALRIADLRSHLEKAAAIGNRIKSFTDGPLEGHSLAFSSQFPLPSLRSSDPRKTLP